MEVDLSKPLVSKFCLSKKVRKIEYDGLYLVCFKCGIYGHREETCCTIGRDADGLNNVNVAEKPEEIESFGPWMLGTKKNKRVNGNQTKKGGRDKIGQELIKENNSFLALGYVDEDQGLEHFEGKAVKEVIEVGRSGLHGRGKRKDVQISKEEVGDAIRVLERVTSGVVKNRVVRFMPHKRSSSHGPNQAAAENEHTVVVGSQGRKKIEKRVVRTEPILVENLDAVIGGVLAATEHHQDPPLTNMVGDGINDGVSRDVCLRIEEPSALADGGQHLVEGNIGLLQPAVF